MTGNETARFKWPLIGVVAAVAVTTAMDATGYSLFSALPLFPLMAVLWYLERLPRADVGFAWGRWSDYGVALLHPLVVLGLVTLVSLAAGQVDTSATDWRKTAINLAAVGLSTFLGCILTEEGFFRGWLWASLGRTGEPPARVLLWSSLAFSLWHLSAVALPTGFDLPARQIPVYMVNAAVMGAIWGLLRWTSGSVLVASLCHGAWNAGAYVLFGFGREAGALGVEATSIFGPEVGVLGLALNGLFFAALWWRSRATDRGWRLRGG